MEQVINWFLQNSQLLYNLLIAALIVLNYIVKLTKNTKDDKWYFNLIEFLRKISWIPKDWIPK